jgi:hypothetical protein
VRRNPSIIESTQAQLATRIPGKALEEMFEELKAVGVARVPDQDERFLDARPSLALLRRVASGLRAMNGNC